MADGYYKKVNSTPAVAPTFNMNSFIIDTYSKTVDASTKYQPKEVELDVDLEQYTDIDITYDQVEQVPWYQQALDAVGNAVVGTLASAGNTVVGLAQGLGEFGEALVDTAAIIGTGAASIFTGAYDLGQWIGGKITGNENWESVTKSMWDDTMGFVSKKYVTTAFNDFHQNNPVGKFLDDNSFAPFKSTGAIYQIADGVGYIGGVILLSLATAGIGGAATAATTGGTAAIAVTPTTLAFSATTAGLGKHTQNAWADGAGLGEGLLYGTGMAAFEGFEMYLGGKINSLKVTNIPGVKGQLINSGTHVLLDSVDGAANAFVDPIFQNMYRPNDQVMAQILTMVNYDENGNQISNKTWDDLSAIEKYNAFFKYNGGWQTVGTRAISAAVVSAISEAPAVIKSVNASKFKPNPNLTSEQNAVLEKLQKASPFNAAKMKNEILASVEGIDDPVLKAKKLYDELNKRLNYSVAWIANSGDQSNAVAQSLYNQTLSFANLKSDSVICKGWSDLYRELLIDSGVPKESITILGGSNFGNHKWVSVDLGQGQVLVADATNNMLGTTDLFNSKMGLPTRGFMVLDANAPTKSPLQLYKKNLSNVTDWEGWARQLDGTLGIADASGYEYEQLLQASKSFGNSQLASEVLGGTPTEFATNRILTTTLPETMDGFEAYMYYRNMLRTIKGETAEDVTKSIIPMLYGSNNTAAAEAISVVKMIGSDNTATYKIYGKNIGDLVITSEEQFQEFISNLNFVMKG